MKRIMFWGVFAGTIGGIYRSIIRIRWLIEIIGIVELQTRKKIKIYVFGVKKPTGFKGLEFEYCFCVH